MLLNDLPTTYKKREDGLTYKIRERLPYNIRGEQQFVNNTNRLVEYPEQTFMHNVKYPFEIVRIIPSITMFDDTATPVVVWPTLHFNVPFPILAQFLRFNIKDVRSQEYLMKDPVRLSDLLNKETLAWEFEAPLYLEASNNEIISIQNLLPATFATGTVGGVASVNCANIQVNLNLQGSLLVLGERV